MNQMKSRNIPAHRLPRTLPFLGVAVRKCHGFLEVYMKTAPARAWRLMLRGRIDDLPSKLPGSLPRRRKKAA